MVPDINGLTIHVLEAGYEAPGRPCVLLLHGFPELAWSWRRIMLPLAAAGFHVVAPDQRGYGLTTGWDASYDGDVGRFRLLNVARDALGLVSALGHRSVAAVVGHDFGSHVAGWCALVRPDVFRSVVMMSAPFAGPPALPFATAVPGAASAAARGEDPIFEALGRLPRPRKHYHRYYSTRDANPEMHGSPQGIHDFLRAYFHHKSADWTENRPWRLAGWTAEELAKMPTYYIMDRDRGMAETVAAEMPSAAEIAACRWLPEDELGVFAREFGRTGFQGGLNWYRCRFVPEITSEAMLFSARRIDVPSAFVAGRADWGVWQRPGDFERMQTLACSRMEEVHLVDGAGHWVQQERSDEVARILAGFLARHR
ncbi:MAG: alpha/beta fold hydrolase [Alphaproteobacteria bacterium]